MSEQQERKPQGCSTLLLFFLAVLLLNLAAVAALMWLALSPSPVETQYFQVDNGAFLAASTKLQSLPAKIKRAVPGEVDSVKLSEAEFNSLLSACLNPNGFAGGQLDKLPLRALNIRIKSGVFYASFSKKIGFWTPFGSWLNAAVRMEVEMPERGPETVKIERCKFGRLGVPPWLAQGILDLQGRAFAKDDSDLRRIVIFMKARDGEVEIKYRADELRKLIESKLDAAPMLKGVWMML